MGESRSSVIGRGLAPMKANAGTLISYSTKEGEVAADGKGKHSPYTEALLKHIETPGIEVGLMLRKVREEVIAATKNKQVPWEYGSLLGEFYFTGPVTIQVQPEPKTDVSKSRVETLYWESIMNDTNPTAFEEYLKKYPDGEFSGLARYKINSLRKGDFKPSPVVATPQSDLKKPFGSIKISSDPSDAVILMDGNPIGNTDMEISGIDVGKRKIELTKNCFETKSTEVFIKVDQQVGLNLKLKPSCGAISITSNPAGAEIHLNDELMGVTPAEMTELKGGTYAISLKKEGYEEWRDTASINAGKTTSVKVGRLKPVAFTNLPQPLTSEINPGAAEQKNRDPHFTVEATPPDSRIKILKIREKYQKGMVLKPGKYQIEVFRDGFETLSQWITMDQNDVVLPVTLTPLQKGSLRVTSDSAGALVYVDGKKAGETPLEISDMFAGQKKVEIKKTCFEPASRIVTIVAGQQAVVSVQLAAQCGSIQISGDASGADVFIDRKRAGSLPVELSDISPGNHQITVKKNGYPDYEETVTVQTGKTTSVTASTKPRSKYSKLDSNGRQLADSAQSWIMVQDNETGLIWEVKRNLNGVKINDNPNDADNTYTWFGCNQYFISFLNSSNWGGFSDWRLPTAEELKTIVVFNTKNPAINTTYFPNTQSSSYWSSTTHDYNSGLAWCVNFYHGRGNDSSKNSFNYVRAVRGGR
jgi:hypothetical protein